MKTHVLMLLGVMSGLALPAAAQDPPPPPPVTQPPATPPAAPQAGEVPAAAAAAPDPAPVTLTGAEVQRRLDAIYVMEGTLISAVKLAARQTALEIQRVQPGLMMFSSAPVKAHGTYLEGYGIVFHIEIPRVIPSVASLVETLGREQMNRERASRGAQTMSLSTPPPDAMLDPDAHYVQSIKTELINAMVKHSHSMDLRPGEMLSVSARDGSEIPGQVAPPSTMTLQVKGKDLADFAAGRITIEQILRRVTVRGF